MEINNGVVEPACRADPGGSEELDSHNSFIIVRCKSTCSFCGILIVNKLFVRVSVHV